MCGKMKAWEGDDELAAPEQWRRSAMKAGMKWAGLRREGPLASGAHWGEREKGEELGNDKVLDHIILDLTGDSVPVEDVADPSVQRAFKRKKRLLRKSNTVLCSRLAIMALVAIMLAATTLLTWYFTSTYGARSVKSLAGVLRQQLLRTSVHTMASVLGEVFNATLILSSLHRQAYATAADTSWPSIEPQLREANKGVFAAQPAFSSVAFVAEDGRLTDLSRNRTGAQFFFFVNETYGENQLWYYQNLTADRNETNSPPPRRRPPPYPLSAANLLDVKPQEVYWTIAPNSLGFPVLAPAVPTRDLHTQKILGVATITSTFQNLNRYLATIDLLGGDLYFEWRNSSGMSQILAYSYNGTEDMLAVPTQASNPEVNGAANFLDSTYGYQNRMALNETHDEDVKIGGQKYYVDTIRLTQPPYDVINLTAVMIVPRKAIMGAIDKRNRTVVGVSVGTSIGVLILGCIFICFVTGRMSTQMQLRQEVIRLLVGKHRAEQSSNSKSQFLANVSHELRTPMAGIIGLLDLLSCDALTSEQEFSVSQIRRCATGLLTLVNNVLDISKVEAGRMELETVAFSVADELESLVDMFAAQSAGSNVDVVLDLSENIPAAVSGDVTRIRQIFTNLISNSLKFTSSGYVLVRGRMDQSLLEGKGRAMAFTSTMADKRSMTGSGSLFMEPEDDVQLQKKIALVFEVEDSGCGIPTELRESVFGSFVQGDSSTTRVYGGSGLGLFIVRSLVELMDGQVAVVPSESGTLIRLYILVDALPGPAQMAPEATSPGEATGLGSLLGHLPPAPAAAAQQQPSPETLERTETLVAMPEGVAKRVAIRWLERSGLRRIKCVNAWENVAAALEEMGQGGAVSLRKLKLTEEDHQQQEQQQIAIPEAEVPERAPKSGPVPPVLALIDVTMHPSMKSFCKSRLKEPTALEAGGPSGGGEGFAAGEVEDEELQLPAHMQAMLASMLRIHRQNAAAVAWIVASDCGPRWKHALQADGRFLVLNKPLHGSRMRRLLGLLTRAGRLEHHHWDAHSDHLHSTSPPREEDERGAAGRRSDDDDGAHHRTRVEERQSGLEQAASRDLPPQESTAGQLDAQRPADNAPSERQPESSDSTPEAAASELPVAPPAHRGESSEANGGGESSTPLVEEPNERVSDEGRPPEMAQRPQNLDPKPPEIDTAHSRQADDGATSCRPSTSATATATTRAGAGTLRSKALSSMHILLVEDTPVLQRLANMMLKRLGANVTVVANGLQAVTAVASVVEAGEDAAAAGRLTPFDLILMDCAMPVMDGYSATMAIRAAEENTDRHIPIVALTAHALASDEEKCLSVGMDAYLTKPINCNLMVTTIQDLVSRGKLS